MKKLICAFVLAVAGTACQHSTPPVAKAATKPAIATAPVLEAATTRSEMVARADSLTLKMRTLLQQYDLAPLWANQTDDPTHNFAMEGFYGSPPYRISFYFSKVERDPAQPTLFHVVGLDRYKKVITPFTGSITVQAIRPFTKEMFADIDSTAKPYTATGVFELKEDPATKGAGRYAGRVVLDFYIDANGRIGQAMDLTGSHNPTKGCGLLFSGTQVSNSTGRRQPVAFANFYGAVVPQALEKLGLGDRSDEVNPNLAKLGWNQVWENDEWWAASPKPKLSL